MQGRRAALPPPLASAIVVVVVVLAVAGAAAEDCPRRDPAARYSSKTAYQLVHDEEVQPQDTVRGCRAAYLWHLMRHGTRYPSPKEIDKLHSNVTALQDRIRANLEAGRVPMCEAAVRRLLAWRLNASRDQGNDLQRQGEEDLLGIATRFGARYPDFFANHSRGDFTFRSTDAQRTRASAAWYGLGLFEEKVDPIVDNTLLKFYAHCPAWDKAVDNNASARAEVTKFQDGDVMKAALQRVSQRLGFEEPLEYEDVDLLWEACRYDQAWNPGWEAVWCAAFSEEDLLVFEYRADLKYYYVGGYGNAMDLQLGCPLVKDLVDKLSAFEGGATASRGSMYFSHSTALHMTLARLGVGRDAVPLTAASYEAMKTHRKWEISDLGPFAANIAVMLYECPDDAEKHKMRMFVNEHPVPVEGCADADALCSWRDFKERFAAVAANCSLDFCGAAPAPSGGSTWHSQSAGILAASAVVLLARLAGH